MAEITEQQKIFCQAMLNGANATQAAITAGYKKSAAHVAGSRLLRNDKVKEYLRILSAEVEKKKILSGAEVLGMLSELAVKTPKHSDKLNALNLLGKYHKLFTELHETQHTFTLMPSMKIGGKPVDFNVGKPKPNR